jgi:hypothetical protein
MEKNAAQRAMTNTGMDDLFARSSRMCTFAARGKGAAGPKADRRVADRHSGLSRVCAPNSIFVFDQKATLAAWPNARLLSMMVEHKTN